MVLCIFLTRGFFGSSEKMVIVGVRRRMDELLGKHMNALRFVKMLVQLYLLACLVRKSDLDYTDVVYFGSQFLKSKKFKYQCVD